MFTRLSVSIVRVHIVLLLLVLCLFSLNIHGLSVIYAKSSLTSYELYKQLILGKRILPDYDKPHVYITPKQPTVYLTFDDGPSAQTLKVLAILQKERIKASFFMVGKIAEEHPEWVKQVEKAGHTIGNHSYNHVYKQLYGHIDEFWRQIQQTERILYDICGIKPELVRAPGGTYKHFDAFYYYDMDEAGYTLMDWNMDSGDSTRANVPAKEIVDKVKQSTLRHEVVLLMHDGTGHGQTVEALPEIIQYFKKMGYAFAPLTTKVKPVQSPIAKNPEVSSYSYDQFQAQEEKVQQLISEHLKQETDRQKADAERQEQLVTAKLKAEEDRAKNKFNVPSQGMGSLIGAYWGISNLKEFAAFP
ncbi:MAG: polysaccharide deacetylase family protein [Paenibacillaceae bacterium]